MKATFIIIALNVIAFIMQLVIPSFTENFMLVSSVAFEKPYTLLSSIFLHGDLGHLGYNMIALFFFGLTLESIVGTRLFLAIFFLAGLDASFVSTFFYDRALGASGAIYGIIGSLAMLRPRMVAFALGVPMPMLAAAAAYLIVDLLGVFYPTNVANIAHITGLFIGAMAGLLLKKKFPEPCKGKSEKIVSERELDEWERKWMRY